MTLPSHPSPAHSSTVLAFISNVLAARESIKVLIVVFLPATEAFSTCRIVQQPGKEEYDKRTQSANANLQERRAGKGGSVLFPIEISSNSIRFSCFVSRFQLLLT